VHMEIFRRRIIRARFTLLCGKQNQFCSVLRCILQFTPDCAKTRTLYNL